MSFRFEPRWKSKLTFYLKSVLFLFNHIFVDMMSRLMPIGKQFDYDIVIPILAKYKMIELRMANKWYINFRTVLMAKEEITAIQKEKIISSAKSAIGNDTRNNETIKESQNVSEVEVKGRNYEYWIIFLNYISKREMCYFI